MFMQYFLSFFLFFYTTLAFSLNYDFSLKNRFNGQNINFIVHRPYQDLSKYPLLVFLHGVGEKAKFDGSRHPLDIALLKKHGPSKLIEQNEWDYDLPFIVASIQCFKGCRFHQPEIIKEVIDEIKMYNPIDEQRVYMTGASMGANGVMRYLAKYPNEIAAAVPIAGWGAGNFCAFSNTAYWGIHNRGDKIVSVRGTLRAHESLRSCSRSRRKPEKITIMESNSHDAWTTIYDKSVGYDIYQYMLSHFL